MVDRALDPAAVVAHAADGGWIGLAVGPPTAAAVSIPRSPLNPDEQARPQTDVGRQRKNPQDPKTHQEPQQEVNVQTENAQVAHGSVPLLGS
jgi:hypothetical protein